MTDNRRYDAIRDGAALAFAEWLTDHNITTYHVIEDGIRTAFREWLDANSDRVTAAIADVARGSA
jgi:hypothetical protein